MIVLLLAASATGPLQPLVSLTAPTMHDIGLAEACGFIPPGTAARMKTYLGARVRSLGTGTAGARPPNFAAASRALAGAFAAGVAGRGKAACLDLATSADRMRGLYDLRNRLPPEPRRRSGGPRPAPVQTI